MSTPYVGPTGGKMLRTHTLASETINRINLDKSQQVFDAPNLRLLQRFVMNPEDKDKILQDEGLADGPSDAPGTKAGTVVGNLVGYVIARHGTSEPLFEWREIEMLRVWFESGAADEAMRDE